MHKKNEHACICASMCVSVHVCWGGGGGGGGLKNYARIVV